MLFSLIVMQFHEIFVMHIANKKKFQIMFIISVITKISLKNIRLDIESITMYIYCTNLRRHRDVDWPFYRRLQTVLVLFSCPLIGVGVAFHESNFHVQFVFPFVLLPRFFHVFSNDPFSDWSWYLKKSV